MFHFFSRKNLRLGKKDIFLGKFISSYHLGSPLLVNEEDVVYIASSRTVRYRVIIPNGPQGFSKIEVPYNIKTQDALLKYLEDSHRFCLKK